MKKLVVILVLIIANSLQAMASDQFQNEIVCNKIKVSGEADKGLTFILRANETARTKVVAVYESNHVGPQLLENIQVPTQPEIMGTNRGGRYPQVNLIYSGKGLTLAIQAFEENGFRITGLGYAFLSLPGHKPIQVRLTCDKVN